MANRPRSPPTPMYRGPLARRFQTQQGRCSEAKKKATKRAEGGARTQTRPLRAQLGGFFQRVVLPLDLAMVSQGTHTDAALLGMGAGEGMG